MLAALFGILALAASATAQLKWSDTSVSVSDISINEGQDAVFTAVFQYQDLGGNYASTIAPFYLHFNTQGRTNDEAQMATRCSSGQADPQCDFIDAPETTSQIYFDNLQPGASKKFTIEVLDDQLVEGDEFFKVSLYFEAGEEWNQDGNRINIATPPHVIEYPVDSGNFVVDPEGYVKATIRDNEDASIILHDSAMVEGEGDRFIFTVELSHASGSVLPTCLTYRTIDDESNSIFRATQFQDYVKGEGPITSDNFAGAATGQILTFFVGARDDNVQENTETFEVEVSLDTRDGCAQLLGSGYSSAQRAVGTFLPENEGVTVTIEDVEREEGQIDFLFTVKMSHMVDTDVTVRWQTRDGEFSELGQGGDNGAFAPANYEANGGSIMFPRASFNEQDTGDDVTEKTFRVLIRNDDIQSPFATNTDYPTFGRRHFNIDYSISPGVNAASAGGADNNYDLSTEYDNSARGYLYDFEDATMWISEGGAHDESFAEWVFTVTVSHATSGYHEASGVDFDWRIGSHNAQIGHLASLNDADDVRVDAFLNGDGKCVRTDNLACGSIPVGSTPYSSTTIRFPRQNNDDLLEGEETFEVIIERGFQSQAYRIGLSNDRGVATINDDDIGHITLTTNENIIAEGGSTNFEFTAILDKAAAMVVTVPFTTQDTGITDKSALAGTDYTFTEGIMTFAANTVGASVTTTVNIIDDQIQELTEQFKFVLSPPQPTSLLSSFDRRLWSPQIYYVDISDDEALTINLDFDSDLNDFDVNFATIDERKTEEDGLNGFTFIAELSHDVSTDMSITWITSESIEGKAKMGQDFQQQSGSLTFGPTSKTQTFKVKTLDDWIQEGVPVQDSDTAYFGTGSVTDVQADWQAERSETFLVELLTTSAYPKALLDPSQSPRSYVRVFDNEEATLTIGDVTGNEGDRFAFEVQLSHASNADVMITYDTVVATATVGSFSQSGSNDYIPTTSGSARIQKGSKNGMINVQTRNDNVQELTETFSVNITNVVPMTQYILANEFGGAVGTINDNEGLTIIISDASIDEETGAKIVFSVTASHAIATDVVVELKYSEDTAMATDYDATNAPTNLTITQLERVAYLTIDITNDDVQEPTEEFKVSIRDVSDRTNLKADLTQRPTAVGTIRDDEFVTYSVADANPLITMEGAGVPASFVITMSHAATEDTRVEWSSETGSASFTDFEAKNAWVDFPAHSTTGTIEVIVNDDSKLEVNSLETFLVRLVDVEAPDSDFTTFLTIDRAVGMAQIQDDETAANDVKIIVSDSISEDETTMVFVITLTHQPDTDVEVSYTAEPAPTTTIIRHLLASSECFAESFDHFTLTEGTITFSKSATYPKDITVTIPLTDNSVIDLDRSFTLVVGETITPVSIGQAICVTGTLGLCNTTSPGTPYAAMGTIKDTENAFLTVNSVSMVEPTEISVTFDYVVTLNRGIAYTMEVDYRTMSITGSATEHSDYSKEEGTLTFSPSEDPQSKTVQVTVFADDVVEFLEEFKVVFDVPTVATELSECFTAPMYLAAGGVELVGSIEAVGSIEGNLDGAQITLTVDKIMVDDNTATPEFVFTIAVDQQIQDTIYLDLVLMHGTTDAGDFDSDMTVFVIELNESTNEVTKTISISRDSLLEADETFTAKIVSLRDASNMTVDFPYVGGNSLIGMPASADTILLTITDTLTSTIKIESTANSTVSEGGDVEFSVVLTENVSVDVKVYYTTTSGSATGDDTSPTSGAIHSKDFLNDSPSSQKSVTLSSMESKTIYIETYDDDVQELTETFTVNLARLDDGSTSPLHRVSVDTTPLTGTINDDEGHELIVEPADTDVYEGGLLAFEVYSTGTFDREVRFSLTSVSGSASKDVDFTDGGDSDVSGVYTRSITAGGKNAAHIYVNTNSDNILEDSETFGLEFANSGQPPQVSDENGADTNAEITTMFTAGIIQEAITPTVTFVVGDVVEGDVGDVVEAVFTVSISHASNKAIEYEWVTTGGSAEIASDFISAAGTLTFDANNNAEQSFNVAIVEDTIHELEESFSATITLKGTGYGHTLTASTTCTIQDDDELEIVISPNIYVEGVSSEDAGQIEFLFETKDTVTGDRDVSFVLQPNVGGGKKADANDLSMEPITISLLAGMSSGNFVVPITNDAFQEDTEDFTFTTTPSDFVPVDYFTVDLTEAVGTIIDAEGTRVYIETDKTGTEETEEITFNARISIGTDRPVTVGWRTYEIGTGTTVARKDVGGANTETQDYVAVDSGTITFLQEAAVTDTQEIKITIMNDNVQEGDESFGVEFYSVSLPTGYNIDYETSKGVAVIVDDFEVATISIIDSAQVAENGSTTMFVSLSHYVDFDVSFKASTVDDTAEVANGDYTEFTDVLYTIPQGENSRSFTVTAGQDEIQEYAEDFMVNLSALDSPVNAIDIPRLSFNGDFSIVTILEEDEVVTLALSGSATDTTSEAASFQVTASLNRFVSYAVTCDWQVREGSAKLNDFTTTSGTFAFEALDKEATFLIEINNDLFVEDDETFTVTVTSCYDVNTKAAPFSFADLIATIINDDTTTVEIGDATANEGGVLSFQVTFSHAVEVPLMFDYTATGTRVTAADVAPTGTTVDYSMCTTGCPAFTIDVEDDAIQESDETFTVQFTPSTLLGSIDVTDVGVGTITDDELATIVLLNRIYPDSNPVSEGDDQYLTYTVTLSHACDEDFDVTVAGADGTADATDYTITNNVLAFTAGSQFQTVDISILSDNIQEPTERFTLSATHNRGDDYTVTYPDQQAFAQIDILDTHLSATIIVTALASYDEGTNADLTVTLSNSISTSLTVNFAWVHGSTDGNDIDEANTPSVTFDATDPSNRILSKTISVASFIADQIVELEETFTVDIISSTFAGVPASQSFTTITSTVASKVVDTETSMATVTVSPAEGPEGSTLSFKVELSYASQAELVLDYATSPADPVTATLTDYTPAIGQLKYGTNQKIKYVEVVTDDDIYFEGPETFNFGVSDNPPYFVLDGGMVVGSIVDNDEAKLSVPAFVLGQEGSVMDFDVTFHTPIDQIMTVVYELDTTDPMVTITTDDLSQATITNPWSITLQPSVVPQTLFFGLSAVADNLVEMMDEFFVLKYSLAHMQPTYTVGQINDKDRSEITVEREGTGVNEGTGGENTDFTFAIKNSVAVDTEFKVTFTLPESGNNNDWTSNSAQVLTFLGEAGETQTVTIKVTQDKLVELDERVAAGVTLEQDFADNYRVTVEGLSVDNNAVVPITNDDVAVLSASSVNTQESQTDTLDFVFTLDNPVDVAVTFNWRMLDSATVAGQPMRYATPQDFTEDTYGSFTIDAQSTQKTLKIGLKEDGLAEGTEEVRIQLFDLATEGRSVTFNSNLMDTNGATIITSQILDADTATISIAAWDSSSPPEGGVFRFKLTSDTTVEGLVKIDYEYEDVAEAVVVANVQKHAEEGSDYLTRSHSVTVPFTTNTLDREVNVAIIDDNLCEWTEVFNVVIKSVTFHTTLADGSSTDFASSTNLVVSTADTHTILIQDDDECTFTMGAVSKSETEAGAFTFPLTLSGAEGLGDNHEGVPFIFSIQHGTTSETDFGFTGTDFTHTYLAARGNSGLTDNVVLNVVDDMLVEGDETFKVEMIVNSRFANIYPQTFAGATPVPVVSDTMTIDDDDTATLTFTNVAIVDEGDELSWIITSDLVFEHATTLVTKLSPSSIVGDLTAEDIVEPASTMFLENDNTMVPVVFAAGTDATTYRITTADDTAQEDIESFVFTVSDVAEGRINVATGSAVINESDQVILLQAYKIIEKPAGLALEFDLNNAISGPYTAISPRPFQAVPNIDLDTVTGILSIAADYESLDMISVRVQYVGAATGDFVEIGQIQIVTTGIASYTASDLSQAGFVVTGDPDGITLDVTDATCTATNCGCTIPSPATITCVAINNSVRMTISGAGASVPVTVDGIEFTLETPEEPEGVTYTEQHVFVGESITLIIIGTQIEASTLSVFQSTTTFTSEVFQNPLGILITGINPGGGDLQYSYENAGGAVNAHVVHVTVGQL